MTAILIFIVTLIGINCIPLLFRKNFPKLEKVVNRIVLIASILFVIFTVLLLNDYRLKGIYSNSIIGIAFVISCLLFFSLVKNTGKKVIRVFLFTPLLVLSLFSLMFGRVIAEYRINDVYNIEVSRGGFLACGDILKINKSEFWIFDNGIYTESNLCLRGINKIETLEFDINNAKFLIYRNGEWDSENPFKYEIENKNIW